MSFDWGKLTDYTDDIEEYLGILKGNELVREYFEKVNAAVPAGTPRYGFYTYQSGDAANAPRDFDLWVDFSYFLDGKPLLGDGVGAEQREYDTKLWEGARQSFDNGVGWASGIGGYLRDICKPFCLPDVEKFRTASAELRERIKWTQMAVPDFASNSTEGVQFGARLDLWVVQGWHSDAATAFHAFYDNLAGKMLMYGNCAIACADLVDAVGGQVSAAQNGLFDFLKSVRDNLREQCVQWAQTRGNPFSYGPPPDLGWVADLFGIGKDIVEAIPLADKIAELPEHVTDVAEGIGSVIKAGQLIDKYVDIPAGQRRPVSFSLETAEQVYNGLTDVLHNDYLGGYNRGLQAIETDRSRVLFDQVQQMVSGEYGDWYPPRVPGIENETHW